MAKQFHTLPTDSKIDPQTELNAIIEFVRATWVIPANLSDENFVKMITDAFNAGLEAGANWYECTDFSLAWHELWEQRQDVLDSYPNHYFHDGWRYFVSCVSDGHRKLERLSKSGWRYENLTNPIVSAARELEGAADIRPASYGKVAGKSYQEVRDEFEDHDCLGYWDDKFEGDLTRSDWEEDTFKGHTFETCGSFPMVGRMALHYVLQSDVNQGRSPLRELLSAIATQGLNLAEWNNTAGAKELIPALLEQAPDTFAQDIPEIPDHDFIRKCYELGQADNTFTPLTPEILAEYERKQAEYDALSDEEKAARKNATTARMKDMIKNILGEDVDND